KLPFPLYGAICRQALAYAVTLGAAPLIPELGATTMEDKASMTEALQQVKLLADWVAAEAKGGSRSAVSTPTEEGASSPLASEDAAILKVLLQAEGVTMTVERIEGKVTISGRTIRKRLKCLRDLKLVEEPAKKKGFCLTTRGIARAKNLPTDAGA